MNEVLSLSQDLDSSMQFDDRPYGITTIPTLFCINPNYAQHLAVSLVSLLENNPRLFFDVVVVFSGDLGDAEARLRRSLASYENVALRLTSFTPPSTMNLPLRAHYSLDCYTRLWIAEFFPGHIDRVLYLDSDLIVAGPIDELWATDLGRNILGAVTIPGSDRNALLGIPPEYGYFNSGVLLIDLAAWRREGIADRIFDFIREEPEKCIDADQDSFNGCLYDRRLALPYIWNIITPFYFDYHALGISETERRAARDRARIVHFNGASKPWSYMSRHPRKADYYKYLRKTDWRAFTPKDRTLINRIKKGVSAILPTSVRNLLHRS